MKSHMHVYVYERARQGFTILFHYDFGTDRIRTPNNLQVQVDRPTTVQISAINSDRYS
jgi:hypothetical protein